MSLMVEERSVTSSRYSARELGHDKQWHYPKDAPSIVLDVKSEAVPDSLI
jgi:hypothetical protein